MIGAAALRPGDRVPEIGTGSGHAAAVMADVVWTVHTGERHAPLAETARERRRDVTRSRVHVGDGTLGWKEAAPHAAILVAEGGPTVRQALRAQLAPGRFRWGP